MSDPDSTNLPAVAQSDIYEKPRIIWCEQIEVRCQVTQSCTRIAGTDPQCDIGSGGTPAT